MTKYKIIYNRKECIGAFTCGVVSSRFWEFDDDGKANLRGSTYDEKTGFYELIIEEKYYYEALESAEVCPVNVIKIIKLD